MGNLPSATPVQIASGAVLDLVGVNETVASLSNASGGTAGAVTNSGTASATLTLAPPAGSTTFSGVIKTAPARSPW